MAQRGASSAAGSADVGPQEITGTVKDALGRPLSKAGLSLQTADGRLIAHTISSAAGTFSFAAVMPYLARQCRSAPNGE